MSTKLLTIAAVVAILVSAQNAGAAYERHEVSNRSERLNRDHMLHKKYYQTDRSRHQKSHEPGAKSQPRDHGHLDDGSGRFHPSLFEKPRLLIDI